MKCLLITSAVFALVAAKPELYKEKEDFQYSRSSTDEGSKAGYYGAQRGNMGGNYEKAHNMDLLAQHQMNGLVKQVDGELGDGINSRTGSVYTAGNSRGIYGSGRYDLSGLKGRNFQETDGSFGNAQSGLSSWHNSEFNSHTGAESSAYTSQQAQNSRYQSAHSLHNTNAQALDQVLNRDLNTYGSQGAHGTGYRSQAGYASQTGYNSAYANQYRANNANSYGSNTKTHLIAGGEPARIIIRPGSTVTIPIAAQTYDASHVSSAHEENAINSEAEILNSVAAVPHSNLPVTGPKHYESSYSYRKEWERHHNAPVDAVPLAIPTENPFPTHSELADNSQALRVNGNRYQAAGLNSHSAYSNSHNSAYDSSIKSSSSRQSAYNANSNLNADTHGAYDAASAADATNQLEGVDTKPKSWHSSYSYHKSWERQGDPYIIYPATNGNTEQSQRLTANAPVPGYTSHQYGSHYAQKKQRYTAYGSDDCDENGHLRVARSADQNQYAEWNQQSQNLEDLGQYNQNLEDLGQQTQNLQDFKPTSQNLEDLGQQTQNLYDFKQYKQNLEELGQQTQNLQDFRQHSENLEDLGQQTQNLYDFKQYNQNIEDLGQQTQNLQDFKQQSENLEDLGQQTQNLHDFSQNFEDLNQQSQRFSGQTQETWKHSDSFGGPLNLSQQTQRSWSDQQSEGNWHDQQNQGNWNGQQTQGNWNGRQNQDRWNEQQTQGRWNDQQSQGNWNGQQTQGSWNAQQSQVNWNKEEDQQQQTQGLRSISSGQQHHKFDSNSGNSWQSENHIISQSSQGNQNVTNSQNVWNNVDNVASQNTDQAFDNTQQNELAWSFTNHQTQHNNEQKHSTLEHNWNSSNFSNNQFEVSNHSQNGSRGIYSLQNLWNKINKLDRNDWSNYEQNKSQANQSNFSHIGSNSNSNVHEYEISATTKKPTTTVSEVTENNDFNRNIRPEDKGRGDIDEEELTVPTDELSKPVESYHLDNKQFKTPDEIESLSLTKVNKTNNVIQSSNQEKAEGSLRVLTIDEQRQIENSYNKLHTSTTTEHKNDVTSSSNQESVIYSHTKPNTQQEITEHQNTDQQFENQGFVVQEHEDLDQQQQNSLHDFNQQEQAVWKPSDIHQSYYGSQRVSDTQQLEDFSQQNVADQQKFAHSTQQIEDFGQQHYSSWNSDHDLQQQSNIQQFENFGRSNNGQQDFYSQRYSNTNENLTEHAKHIQSVQNNPGSVLDKQEVQISTTSQPSTEQPSFWKSIGSKFSNAKEKVVSWWKS